MKRLIIPLLLLLAACRAGTPDYTPQTFQFNTQPPIRLNVADIRVVNSSIASSGQVEQEFPTPPAKAIVQWVEARLARQGVNGILEITIEDASVREVRLPKTESFTGLFTAEPDRRFDASLRVTFRLYTDSSGLSNAEAQVNITRSQELTEDASIAQRQQLFDSITRDLMTQFEAQANSQLRQYFAAYLL